MINLSGARCLAISLAGAVLGWWIALGEPSKLAHYKSLSHDALLAELTRSHSGNIAPDLIAGVFFVGGAVIAVDVLTRFFDAVWARISPGRSLSQFDVNVHP